MKSDNLHDIIYLTTIVLVLLGDYNMKLYRYVNEQELRAHISGDFSQILSEPTSQNTSNNKALLTFFPNKDYCLCVRHDICKSAITAKDNFYFCEFNIPLYIALPTISYGLYKSPFFLEEPIRLKEFKIPITKLQPAYLIRYKKDKYFDKKWLEVLSQDYDESVIIKSTETPSPSNNFDDIEGYDDLLKEYLGHTPPKTEDDDFDNIVKAAQNIPVPHYVDNEPII